VGHSDTHRTLHRFFNERQFDAMREHLAPEFTYEDLPRQLVVKSTDEFIDYLTQGWATSFSDAEVASVEYLEGAESSVAVFHGRGTNDGLLADFPPTGRPMDVVFTEAMTFGSDGRAVSGRLNYDQLTLLVQLGLIPAPGAHPAG
jgi:SnoaL-like polyketide cyclase